MEKTFETKESRELRLWYVEACIHPSKKYRKDLGANTFVVPVMRRFQIWYHDWFGNGDGGDLKRFFDSCNEEGRFQIEDIVDNTGFSRVHLDGYVPSRQPLMLAEAIYGEAFKERESMGEDKFKRYFRKGEGEITCVAYAPTSFAIGPTCNFNGESLWYRNLYTDVTNIARMFSFHDFVHILGKSSPIQEEQIRRYDMPKKVGKT